MNGGHGLWPSLGDGPVRGVDRVELKIILPVVGHEQALAVLGADPRGTRLRRVYFLDTPDLELAGRGVIVRARRTRHGVDDSVVKLRRGAAVSLPGQVRRSPNLTVELDALPGTILWSAALRQRLQPAVVRAAVNGRRPLRTLLSREQRAFLLAHATAGVQLDDLRVHGPIEVCRMATTPSGPGRGLVLESWVYPDGSRLLEASTKCAPGRAVRIAARMERALRNSGVALPERGDADPDRTKAGISLRFFTRGDPPPGERAGDGWTSTRRGPDDPGAAPTDRGGPT